MHLLLAAPVLACRVSAALGRRVIRNDFLLKDQQLLVRSFVWDTTWYNAHCLGTVSPPWGCKRQAAYTGSRDCLSFIPCTALLFLGSKCMRLWCGPELRRQSVGKRGVLFNPKGLFLQSKRKRAQQAGKMTGSPPWEQEMGDTTLGRAGMPEERQRWMKTKWTLWLTQGKTQPSVKGSASPSTTLLGLRWKEFHLRAAEQGRYTISAPHPISH